MCFRWRPPAGWVEMQIKLIMQYLSYFHFIPVILRNWWRRGSVEIMGLCETKVLEVHGIDIFISIESPYYDVRCFIGLKNVRLERFQISILGKVIFCYYYHSVNNQRCSCHNKGFCRRDISGSAQAFLWLMEVLVILCIVSMDIFYSCQCLICWHIC